MEQKRAPIQGTQEEALLKSIVGQMRNFGRYITKHQRRHRSTEESTPEGGVSTKRQVQ